MAPKPKKIYNLKLVGGGERKITIPANWKLTFGNVLPFNKQKLGGTGGPYNPPGDGWESRVVLRVYEGSKDNLRAVWNDVVSFHCEDIYIHNETSKLAEQYHELVDQQKTLKVIKK